MDVDELIERAKARPETYLPAIADTLRELQGERDRARRSASILPKLDCRYTGTGLSDIDGSHCSLKEPCQRCRLERERDALRAENERLREALELWDSLIEYNYTGSREAMSAMTNAAQLGAKVLGIYPADDALAAREE